MDNVPKPTYLPPFFATCAMNIDITSTAPKVPSSGSWKLRSTLIMLLVVFAYATAVTFLAKYKRKRADKATEHDTHTIFVALFSDDSDACTNMVSELFRASAFPGRVHVGVVADSTSALWTQPPPARDAVGVYVDDAAWMPLRSFRYHRIALQELYRNEKYIMFMPPRARVQDKWDAVLVAALNALPVHACLTHKVSNCRGSFLAFANSRGIQLPVVRSIPFTRPQDGSTEMLCWTADFTFIRANTLLAANVYDPQHDVDVGGEDAYGSAVLWTSGVRFYTPPQFVVCRVGAARPRPSRAALVELGVDTCHEAMVAMLLTRYRAYAAYAGVEWSTSELSLRAMMGLVSSKNDSELLAKYGSWAEYERAKAIIMDV